MERPISNARHAIWNGDGGKFFTTDKGIIPNARHTVRDGDGGKAGALVERIICNARYTTANLNGCNRCSVTIPGNTIRIY